MYIPPHFQMSDLPEIHQAMRAARLASLVTSGPDGLIATPVPLYLAADEGPQGTLYGHIARANPQWRAEITADALAIFMGPDAYVTPNWYATKQESGKVVPTWNYVAVHASGPVEFFEDPERLREVVTRLTDLHERESPGAAGTPQGASHMAPWAVSDAPERFIQGQLRGIVGLRLPIHRLEGKSKMSQNRSEADRAGVIDGLSASDRASDKAAAALVPK